MSYVQNASGLFVPPEYSDVDDYDDDGELDEDELIDLECGMMPDGQCSQAGTEYCDFECSIGCRARM